MRSLNFSDFLPALWFTQPLTESVSGIFLGVKGGRSVKLKNLTAICDVNV
jgi:hypothetical protein